MLGVERADRAGMIWSMVHAMNWRNALYYKAVHVKCRLHSGMMMRGTCKGWNRVLSSLYATATWKTHRTARVDRDTQLLVSGLQH